MMKVPASSQTTSGRRSGSRPASSLRGDVAVTWYLRPGTVSGREPAGRFRPPHPSHSPIQTRPSGTPGSICRSSTGRIRGLGPTSGSWSHPGPAVPSCSPIPETSDQPAVAIDTPSGAISRHRTGCSTPSIRRDAGCSTRTWAGQPSPTSARQECPSGIGRGQATGLTIPGRSTRPGAGVPSRWLWRGRGPC